MLSPMVTNIIRYVERIDETLKYTDGKLFNISDLFAKKARKSKKRIYISYDLTWDSSVCIRQLLHDYEYVDDIREIKREDQWGIVESPSRVYMILTKSSIWSSMVARMGLDGNYKDTCESMKVDTLEALYKLSLQMGFDKITLASSAMAVFKDGIETGKMKIGGKEFDVPQMTMDEWRGYGVKDIPYLDLIYRPTFRGGETWGKKGVYKDDVHIDIRSSYPASACDYRMPYGLPHDERESPDDIELIAPYGELHLKPGCIPMIGFSNPKRHREHALSGRMGALLEDLVFTGNMFFFDFEWEVIKQMYDWNGDVAQRQFVSTVEPIHFQVYFRECYKVKNHSKKETVAYISSKKLLNALYGKLVLKTMRETISYEEGKRHTIKREVRDLSYYHLLAGACITAHSRVKLMKMAMKIGLEHIHYMDTDSLFYDKKAFTDREKMLTGCEIGTEMGQWDLEEEGVELNVIGPKTYQTKRKDKVTTKCAGLDTSISNQIPWLDLYVGMKIPIEKKSRGRDGVLRIKPMSFTVSDKAMKQLEK